MIIDAAMVFCEKSHREGTSLIYRPFFLSFFLSFFLYGDLNLIF